MTSIRARCLNGLMRLTLRRQLKKGMTLSQIRAQAAQNDSRAVGSMHNCSVEEIPAAPAPTLRIAAPGSRDDHAILYFHGGGFCIHMPQTYQRHAARISHSCKAPVFLVDYRLAPEHSLTACFDDAYASWEWLLSTGLPASSIVIAGDSAGGGLTLGTGQRARDSQGPLPAGLLMISPGLDASFSTPSMRTNDGKDPAFTYAGIVCLRDMTLCHGEDVTDPLLSPGRGDYAKLPPMRFDVGTTELLLDDSRLAAQNAKACGVEVVMREWPAMAHVFQLVPWVPETRQWLLEAAEFTQSCWQCTAL